MRKIIAALLSAFFIISTLNVPLFAFAADLDTDLEVLGLGDIYSIDADTEVESQAADTTETELVEITETELVEIISIMKPDDLYFSFLSLGEPAENLALPKNTVAMFSRFQGIECGIAWRYDDFNNTVLGRQTIVGDIILPEGYVFSDEPLVLKADVLVYDPQAEATERVVSCVYTYFRLPVIPLGTDMSALSDFFSHIEPEAFVTTVAGDSFYAPVKLDMDVIDTNTAGIYYPISIDLPPCVEISELAPYVLGIHVIPSDTVVLDAVSLYQSGFSVQWLHPANAPTLWVSVDNEEWETVEADEQQYHSYGRFVDNGAGTVGLEIFLSSLLPGKVYRFQIQYDEQQFSNVLVMDFTDNDLPKASNEQGGDRNGGDRGENTLPPPQPLPPPSPLPPSDNGNLGSSGPEGDNSGTDTGNGSADSGNSSNVTIPDNSSSENDNQTGNGNQADNNDDNSHQGNHSASENGDNNNQSGDGDDAGPIIPDNNSGNDNHTNNSSGTPDSGTPPNATENNSSSEHTYMPGAENQEAEAPTGGSTAPIVPPASDNDVQSTELGVIVSGEQLALMMEVNPHTVAFFNGELRVSLPTEQLAELDVQAEDSFFVQLYQANSQEFTVSFSINDEPLIPADAFEVSLPWNGYALSGESESGAVIDAELSTGRAAFHLTETGTYTLTEMMAVSINTEPNTAPINTNNSDHYSDNWRPTIYTVLCSIAGIGLAATAYLLLRRRWNRV